MEEEKHLKMWARWLDYLTTPEETWNFFGRVFSKPVITCKKLIISVAANDRIFLNRNQQLTHCCLVSVSRAELNWSFTAEAADNTLPAAAEDPGEGAQPWDRTQGACWSCDRLTYPWALLPEVRSELQELRSCIECSRHCWEESRVVNIESPAILAVSNE